jgi:hypothetical protein
MSQVNPVHTLTSYILKDSGIFPSGFPTNIFYVFLISIMLATSPAHLILLDTIILIVSGEE